MWSVNVPSYLRRALCSRAFLFCISQHALELDIKRARVLVHFLKIVSFLQYVKSSFNSVLSVYFALLILNTYVCTFKLLIKQFLQIFTYIFLRTYWYLNQYSPQRYIFLSLIFNIKRVSQSRLITFVMSAICTRTGIISLWTRKRHNHNLVLVISWLEPAPPYCETAEWHHFMKGLEQRYEAIKVQQSILKRRNEIILKHSTTKILKLST